MNYLNAYKLHCRNLLFSNGCNYIAGFVARLIYVYNFWINTSTICCRATDIQKSNTKTSTRKVSNDERGASGRCLVTFMVSKMKNGRIYELIHLNFADTSFIVILRGQCPKFRGLGTKIRVSITPKVIRVEWSYIPNSIWLSHWMPMWQSYWMPMWQLPWGLYS